MPISFPGLFGDWEFNPDPVAIHVGHGIYWYGIILAVAMLSGLFLCMKQAKKYGFTEDNVMDMALWAVPCCIIGSRIYYVLFNLDLYRDASGALDWSSVIAIWDGGIAIYGTVIAGIIVAVVFACVKKLKLAALTDLAALGLLLGQIIGRWANFINREAFGAETTLPWRMRLWATEYRAIEVHPTFFYESAWNLIGLLLILFVVSKARRFDGENTCFYFLWYGIGRFWIEGLRTDSLYLFDWTLFGEPIRVSQALSLVLAIVGAVGLFYMIRVRKSTSDGLYVNQIRAAAEAAAASAEAAEAAEADGTAEAAKTEETAETAETDKTAEAAPAQESDENTEQEKSNHGSAD